MYEQDKSMQYAFYCGVVVFFVFACCYFGTSHIDGRRSEDARARISDSQNINSELQRATENSQAKVRGTIEGLGSAEAELNRAERSIERCQQILGTAESRAQKTDSSVK